MQERGRSGTPTLGFRSRSCVCSPWMRCGIDPDKLSVGQSNDDQDGSKPMVGTTNRSMAWPQRSPPGCHGTVLPKHQWPGEEPIFEGTDATYTITCVPTSTTRPVGIWKTHWRQTTQCTQTIFDALGSGASGSSIIRTRL